MKKILPWVLPSSIFAVPALWGLVATLFLKELHWLIKWGPFGLVMLVTLSITATVMYKNYKRLSLESEKMLPEENEDNDETNENENTEE